MKIGTQIFDNPIFVNKHFQIEEGVKWNVSNKAIPSHSYHTHQLHPKKYSCTIPNYNPKSTWIKAFQVLKISLPMVFLASLSRPNGKYLSVTGNNWKQQWLYPFEDTYFIFKILYHNLLNKDFHNFINTTRYTFFWIGNKYHWRMNFTVNVWTAPGIGTYSKVFYDFPANLYIVSKPSLISVGKSDLIYIFINILCSSPKTIYNQSH